MLTREALEDRKWKSYQTLRIALENPTIPERYFGPTSVSDNIFEATSRLLEVAIVVKENKSAIAASVSTISAEALHRDVSKLGGDLHVLARMLNELASDLDELHETIEKRRATL